VVRITVVAVLSTCGTVSVNEALIPVTLTRCLVVVIVVDDGDTVSLDASTGGVWVEVVIIAVLAVPEAFVIGMDVLEVVLAGHTRVLELVLGADLAAGVLTLSEFTVVSVAYVSIVT